MTTPLAHALEDTLSFGFTASFTDPGAARELLRRGCEAGDGPSCVQLGHWLREGVVGIPRDLDRAAGLYDKACVQGDAHGCEALGEMHLRGHGARRDPERARALFAHACEAGRREACAHLGTSGPATAAGRCRAPPGSSACCCRRN